MSDERFRDELFEKIFINHNSKKGGSTQFSLKGVGSQTLKQAAKLSSIHRKKQEIKKL